MVEPNLHQTIMVNLDKDPDILIKEMKRDWRKNLHRAERNNLNIVSGTDAKLFSTFLELYKELIETKKFKEYVNPTNFIQYNEQNEEDFKLMTFIAYKDGKPVSGLVGSAIGETGLSIFSATNELGKKLYAAYLLQLQWLLWCKQKGCLKYDLGGIDPIENKGVYDFKKRICDNEVTRVGTFESHGAILSRNLVWGTILFKNLVIKR